MTESERVFTHWLQNNNLYRKTAEEAIGTGKMCVFAGVLLTALSCGLMYGGLAWMNIGMSLCGLTVTITAVRIWYRADKALADSLYKRADMLTAIFERRSKDSQTAADWIGYVKKHMAKDEWTLHDRKSS